MIKGPRDDYFLLSKSQYFGAPCIMWSVAGGGQRERKVFVKDGTALSVSVNDVGAITTKHCWVTATSVSPLPWAVWEVGMPCGARHVITVFRENYSHTQVLLHVLRYSEANSVGTSGSVLPWLEWWYLWRGVCLEPLQLQNLPRKLVFLWVSNPGSCLHLQKCSSSLGGLQRSWPEPVTLFPLLYWTQVPPLRARSHRRRSKPKVLWWRENSASVGLDQPGKFTFWQGSFQGKALLHCFWSFSSFVLRKRFPFKSTVRFVSKSSVGKMYLD